jgi:malonyl-CoA decarboxylase
LAEAPTEQLAPPLNRTEPAGDESTLVGRAFSRWTRVIRDIAASARLPFSSSDDPDLGADQAEWLRAEMRTCLQARGGEVLARAQAAGIASVYLGLSQTGRARFFEILATEFGVERAAADRAIARYQEASGEADKLAAERALRRALVSPGMRLLTKFNALPEGTRFLIDMRADLLALNSQPTSVICWRPGSTSAFCGVRG